MAEQNFKFRRGIYETEYGNDALVSGPKAKTAWDIDAAERIPIEVVTRKWKRAATSNDSPNSYNY